MDKIEITGPSRLSGEVTVSSAKNACLPIVIGALLNEGKTHFKNLPNLRDMRTLKKLMEGFGVKIEVNDNDWFVDASSIENQFADYDLVKTMRASVLVLGPLLARFGKAKVSLPGGCAIGTRPVDLHLEALKKMGAEIEISEGYIFASCKKLKGEDIFLSFPSVGATENIMMAASLASGVTIINNAAREPEIVDLANFLKGLGVEVIGAGESIIKIKGMETSIHKDISYECIPDRIEAATYIMAALATGSEIEVKNINIQDMRSILDVLENMGAKFQYFEKSLKTTTEKIKRGFLVETAPFPGFPTDAQAQLMALGCLVDDKSLITESVFENRFMHVPELVRMGADIKVKGKTSYIEGGRKLRGARVMCTDLRASAALVIAALCAEGTTKIDRVYHLDRGYSEIDQKLKKLGVEIKRVEE